MNDIKDNGLVAIIAQTLEVMGAKAVHNIPLDKVNLAELGRLTGLSRSKLRTLKKNGFQNGIKSKLPCVKHNNFLAGRTFLNITGLNMTALNWCDNKNNVYRTFLEGKPADKHATKCSCFLHALELSDNLKFNLAPLRTIIFDGFVSYESRCFDTVFTSNHY